MKGVSYWFWIIGGVIGGLLIFTIAFQQLVGMKDTTIQQRTQEQFSQIKNIIDNLCWGSPGNKREYTISVSESVEGIYLAPSKYKEYETEELTDIILSEEYATGDYLCIKVKDKRLKCEELECDATMPFVGSVPEEFSLTALVNKLTGRGKFFDYPLEFERMGDYVDVRIKHVCKPIPISFDQLIKCNNKDIVALRKNLLIVGDSTFFVECCDQLSEPFEALLVNSAKYFGGSKMLIIWEDPQANPDADEKTRLTNTIKENGFSVESFHHDSKISSETLNNYDQVWLIRPGICENPAMQSYCDYKWKESEFDAFETYLTKGKVVLITDYPHLVPPRVGNKIIKLVDQNITLLQGCFCSCKGETTRADEIFTHEITAGIEDFFVKASAGVDMECIT